MDLEKLKVVDLRKELQQRGLDTKGNKAVLIKRLKDAMDEESNKGPGTATAGQATVGDGSPNEEEEQSEEEPELKPPRKEEVKPIIKTDAKSPRKDEIKPVVQEEAKSPKKDEVKTPKKDLTADPVSPEKKLKVGEPTASPSKSQDTESHSESNGDQCGRDIERLSNPIKGAGAGYHGISGAVMQAEASKETDEEGSESDEKDEEKMQTEASETRGEKRKRDDEDAEEPGTRGEKRRRDDKSSPEKPPTKKRERSPPKEDEPEIDYDKPQLSWYDSDLHLQVDKKTFLSAKPLNDGCMGYIWAGARATHGISSGKMCFEVKITEELKWEDPSKYMQERKEREHQSHRYKIDRRKDKSRSRRDSESKSDDKKSEKDKTKEGKTENGKNAEESEKSEEAEEKMETEDTEDKEKDENATVEEESEDKEEKVVANEEKTEEKDDEEKKEDTEDDDKDKKDEDEAKMETDPDKEKAEEKPKPDPIPAHYFRVGFSLLGTSLQLGECPYSFAYESTGKFVTDKTFQDYGITFGAGDVVGAYLSIDNEMVTITFTVNGALQPTAISLPRSEFPEENFTLVPHVLCRNYAYELNFGANEEPWFPHPEELQDYQFLQSIEEKVAGPKRPETRGDCEIILLIGLPGTGKTTWVKKHIESTTDRAYTVIGNNPIFERMTVDGQPLRGRFGGSWKMLVDKIQKCLNTLTDIASLRRRNFIIDQTNVFPNAQRRKLRAFEGFKRKAVCVICDDEEHARRQKEHENDYGKIVPESTMLDLKAQMELPEKCDWLEELIFTDLNEEDAKKKLKEYTEEANKKGYFRRWRVDDKRNQRGYRDRRGYGGGSRYDRYDRYSQGGWRQSGGGGWGRDRRDRGPPPRDGWRQPSRGPRSMERDRRDVRSGGGYGGGRSSGRSGDGWQSSGSWGSGNSQGGGWNAQMYGSHGYGAWSQQGQGWKASGQSSYGGGQGGGYGGSSQSGYGGYGQGYGSSQSGYGTGQSYGGGQGGYGQQNWNYYGQYSQQQGWGNAQAQTKGKAAGGGQQANYSQQDWAQYAKQYAQQQQAQARK